MQQYSVDLNRELRRQLSRSASSTSARPAATSGSAARTTAAININQVDPSHLALGSAALIAAGAEPVLRDLPRAAASTSATIPAPQSLRPFPQFSDILMRQTTVGKNQYHAAILKLEKRMRNGWGGRLNYTYSRLKDNQFGEGNLFSATRTATRRTRTTSRPSTRSACSTCRTSWCSRRSIELPFGEGKRWVQSGVGARDSRRLDDLVDRRVRERVPDLGLAATRTDYSAVLPDAAAERDRHGDPATDGDARGSRLVTARATAVTGMWLNSAAFADPRLHVRGTLPRTLGDVRTPHRNNWDFVGRQGRSPRRRRAAPRSSSRC